MRCTITAVSIAVLLTCGGQTCAQGFLDQLENVLDAEAQAGAARPVPKTEVAEVPGYLGLVAEEEFGSLRVDMVRDGTAAAAAGVRPGDLIQGVDDRKVATLDEMGDALAGRLAGDEIELTIFRGDKEMRIPITLGARPEVVRAEPRVAAPVPEPGADAADALRELEAILDAAPPVPKAAADRAKARERRIGELEEQLQKMKRHIAELERELAEIAGDK